MDKNLQSCRLAFPQGLRFTSLQEWCMIRMVHQTLQDFPGKLSSVAFRAEEAAWKDAGNVEAERNRVEAVLHGSENDEAMMTLAEAEEDAERKAAEAELRKSGMIVSRWPPASPRQHARRTHLLGCVCREKVGSYRFVCIPWSNMARRLPLWL